MKIIVVAAMLLFATGARAQETPKRVALLKSNYSMAQVIKFVDKCGGLTLIGDTEKADYLLVIEEEPNRGKHTALTLLSPNGDVLFTTRTLALKNAFKDLCTFMHRVGTTSQAAN